MNLLPKPTANNGDLEVWLGARDLKVNGQFTWTNSSPNLDFTDWGPKEPNGRYYEECLATHLYRDGKLHWNDRACARRSFFVCEKRLLNHLRLRHWYKRNQQIYKIQSFI
ncbi:Hypothetical predicted protein [Mytilus galloprovincialis]|uniref:C-type lectin domain-containing protein n=1 Tax=Mytilus galloprovincialis TaxID=29158 RepID=A0A8B6EUV4_MYTGA|nr:Hypothetical predicted protein [Mytilus galloprovincialis]